MAFPGRLQTWRAVAFTSEPKPTSTKPRTRISDGAAAAAAATAAAAAAAADSDPLAISVVARDTGAEGAAHSETSPLGIGVATAAAGVPEDVSCHTAAAPSDCVGANPSGSLKGWATRETGAAAKTSQGDAASAGPSTNRSGSIGRKEAFTSKSPPPAVTSANRGCGGCWLPLLAPAELAAAEEAPSARASPGSTSAGPRGRRR
mmetsp:Transcript_81252/g.211104  ORF Transcript_81252/g.211104 Transcript_81252/m.211104 type:complete len:204 (+) Transcript_81252:475-1086(+)